MNNRAFPSLQLSILTVIAILGVLRILTAHAAEIDVLPAQQEASPASVALLQATSPIQASIPLSMTILGGFVRGRHWAYLVPFAVQNVQTIEALVGCESQGVNVSRPDSNGRVSDGILQFNRGADDTLGSGTWADMEARFHFSGSPVNPPDAIHLTDKMITAGLLGRWSCAHILGLVH